jgi:AcrR family transcriptional regulator
MKKMLAEDERPAPGLRERKKAKTRAAIQREALRLFREQGYDETTVSQIAEAVEISPSTFFRYFPSKEDVVLYDDLDPLLFAAFEVQPVELSPVQAIRGALREVFAQLPADEMAQQMERSRWILGIPELRTRVLEQFIETMQMLSALLAKRVGRPADDPKVQMFAGALMGVLISALLTGIGEPKADFLALVDESLAYLEAGLPL